MEFKRNQSSEFQADLDVLHIFIAKSIEQIHKYDMIVVEDLELVKLQGLMNLEIENVCVTLNENYIFFLAGILE